ncbi:conserved exported hypothetical protein [Crenothrix polyspora]|uniref:Secreted protein n=1 Tax=Crenothrix polyspora TaxID=360316 RepID=A0A1R4H9D7_9GAMM|nr:hypothetical protein [Crenothrix polyspora]SJM92641.1 conserved exported hypothetical protein [Crenothrix polyspora]
MNVFKLMTAFFLAFLLSGNAQAAGNPVSEDFSLLLSLCDNMVELATRQDDKGFFEVADAALKLAEAQRRNSSMALDRVRPKLRSAKKSVKSGDYDASLKFIAEAKALMKPTSVSWDGGS